MLLFTSAALGDPATMAPATAKAVTIPSAIVLLAMMAAVMVFPFLLDYLLDVGALMFSTHSRADRLNCVGVLDGRGGQSH